MTNPPSDNPFASPQPDEPEVPSRTEPCDVPATVVLAVLGCSASGVLLVMLGNMSSTTLLTAAGWFGVFLAVTLFLPIRFGWYLALYSPALSVLAVVHTADGNAAFRVASLLPALLYGIVMLLIALPGSRRYYGFCV